MSVVSLRDLEIIAGQKTPHDMWDFIDGAAFRGEKEESLRQ